jgi:hypothetical protein
MAAMPPMADPTAMPTMALVLRPFASAAVEVGAAAETKALLEVEVGIVEVKLPGTVVDDCVDTELVEGVELLVEDVVVTGSTINPREGIFGDPTYGSSKASPGAEKIAGRIPPRKRELLY